MVTIVVVVVIVDVTPARRIHTKKKISSRRHTPPRPTPDPVTPARRDIIFSDGKHKPSATFNIIYVYCTRLLYYYIILYTHPRVVCDVSCASERARACEAKQKSSLQKSYYTAVAASRRRRRRSCVDWKGDRRGWKSRRKTFFFSM